ncbi:MAG: Rrf2 family transcriptional regulator [Saprospiraceae bacterium]|nr:Rrf2 family transcriptional regulator [Saprospiraceae bacterium]
MIYFALQARDQDENEITYIGVSQVKDAIGSPQPFTAKILQQLSKAGMLESLRGPNGGFCLPKDFLSYIKYLKWKI